MHLPLVYIYHVQVIPQLYTRDKFQVCPCSEGVLPALIINLKLRKLCIQVYTMRECYYSQHTLHTYAIN